MATFPKTTYTSAATSFNKTLELPFLRHQRKVLTLIIGVKCSLCLSSYTYEVSPVFILVEEAVLKKMIEFIGWEEGDGIFNPGEYNWLQLVVSITFPL